jgi:hypothetical protein
MRWTPFLCFTWTLVVIYFVYSLFLLVPPSTTDPLPVKYDLNSNNALHTVPFYHKSKRIHNYKEDVTLVSQVSIDRLDRIKDIAEAWLGPMSVAVYVRNSTAELSVIDELIANGTNSIPTFVDFHVLFANKTRYPVNNLRNLALKNAQTRMAFIFDADFIPSPGLHAHLSNITRSGDHTKRSYVIPAFMSELNVSSLPKTKQDLIRALIAQTVAPVNMRVCPKCHGPTDYDKWYFATEPYDAEYKWIFEPFLVFDKDELPEMFIEQLKGYGYDKNTQVFAMAAAGYRFTVLPDVYMIHRKHPVASWDGGSLRDQTWEALTLVVCDFLEATKTKHGHDPALPLFDEPVEPACSSRDNW